MPARTHPSLHCSLTHICVNTHTHVYTCRGYLFSIPVQTASVSQELLYMFRSYCYHGNVSHDERNCRDVSLKTNKKMLFTVYFSSSVTVLLKRPQNVSDVTGRFTGFILGLLRRSVARKEKQETREGNKQSDRSCRGLCCSSMEVGRPRAQRGSVSVTGVALALDSC